MKRSVSLKWIAALMVSLSVMPGILSAQVIADFETGQDGYVIGWGDAITAISQTADPTGASAGVLSLSVQAGTVEQKGAIQRENFDPEGIDLVQYYIYLPANTPDSLFFQIWGLDDDWTWGATVLYAINIPKEVFYPVYFDIKAADIANSEFNITTDLRRIGIEIATWDLSGDDSTWVGTIYLDNVAQIRTQEVIADFETNQNGFGIAWGEAFTSVSQVPDPTEASAGALALEFNAQGFHGAVKRDNIDPGDLEVITFYVYLPDDTPDSLDLQPYVLDQDWTWSNISVYAKDIPKNTFYPLHFHIPAAHIKNNEFEINTTFNQIGLQIGAWNLSGVDTTWIGTVYLDNVALLDDKAPYSGPEIHWLFAEDADLDHGAALKPVEGSLGMQVAYCPADSSVITFTFEIENQGDWYAWGRFMFLGSGMDPNSFWFSVDDSPQNSFGNNMDSWNTWHWDGDGSASSGQVKLSLGRLTAGEHIITLKAREPIGTEGAETVLIDMLCLTNDADEIPSDAKAPVRTDIEDFAQNTMPREFALRNYPNPFNPETNIQITLPRRSQVSLDIFDVLGKKVVTLIEQKTMPAGIHVFKFDASNLSSGIYIYRLKTESMSLTKRMIFVR